MSIKRIQPFNQTDLDALSDMLDRAFQNISPSNLESQILDKFNTIFPRALNDSLNHQAFSKKIQYSYPHTNITFRFCVSISFDMILEFMEECKIFN